MNNIEKVVELLARIALCRTAQEESALFVQLEEAMRGTEPAPKLSVEDAVQQILDDIGMPCSLRGRRYAVAAICLVCQNSSVRYSVTKTIYPEVAKCFGPSITAGSVERAIRHAIEVAFDRCPVDIIRKYFGNTLSPNTGMPTNSEFIYTIAACANHAVVC